MAIWLLPQVEINLKKNNFYVIAFFKTYFKLLYDNLKSCTPWKVLLIFSARIT
jgi:hypothetical protein